MEWFDTKSVALLFDVTHKQVLRWITQKKLLGVKRPCRFVRPDPTALNGYRYQNLTQWLIPRTELENFLLSRIIDPVEQIGPRDARMQNKNALDKSRLTIKKLAEDGQHQGEFQAYLSDLAGVRHSSDIGDAPHEVRQKIWARFLEDNPATRQLCPAPDGVLGPHTDHQFYMQPPKGCVLGIDDLEQADDGRDT